ncbi:MAG: SPOR domain-containing protein [Saprospiraceae bacterium]|nr:SPOR domain-containing protein [Saprospiraceae bacterium]
MSNLQLSSGSFLFILFLLIVIISLGSSYFRRLRNNGLMNQIPAGAPLSIFFFLIIILFLVIYYQKFPRQQQSTALNKQPVPTKGAQMNTVQGYQPYLYGKADSVTLRNMYPNNWQQPAKPSKPLEYSNYENRSSINRMVLNRDTIIKPTWANGFSVQAVAFHDEASAIKYALRLYEKFDLPIVWYEGTDRQGYPCYRVLIGLFSSKQAADQFAQSLPRYGFNKGFKVDLSTLNLTLPEIL